MRKFDGVDFYNLDTLLSDEEKAVREAVRGWVEANVIPIIEQHCRTSTFPRHLVRQMGEMGLLGVNLHGYGCAGMSNVAYGLVCQELERGDSGIRSFASVQGSLVMFPIWKHGTEEQKQKYLPKMATGEFIGCFGLTEPDFGSNPGGMVTKAVDDGNSYVLNGAKMWITNGTISDLAVVWAKLDGVIRGFIVEAGDPGFSAPETHGKHSLKASVTSELVFQDCRIPKDRLLPHVAGLKGPFSCLNNARYGIAWGALGAAMACFHSSREYSLSRIQFGKPIAGFQLVQNKLAWMLREITKGQLLALQLGRKRLEFLLVSEYLLIQNRQIDKAAQQARIVAAHQARDGLLDVKEFIAQRRKRRAL